MNRMKGKDLRWCGAIRFRFSGEQIIFPHNSGEQISGGSPRELLRAPTHPPVLQGGGFPLRGIPPATLGGGRGPPPDREQYRSALPPGPSGLVVTTPPPDRTFVGVQPQTLDLSSYRATPCRFDDPPLLVHVEESEPGSHIDSEPDVMGSPSGKRTDPVHVVSQQIPVHANGISNGSPGKHVPAHLGSEVLRCRLECHLESSPRMWCHTIIPLRGPYLVSQKSCAFVHVPFDMCQFAHAARTGL